MSANPSAPRLTLTLDLTEADNLVQLIDARVALKLAERERSGYLNTEGAATYLCCPVSRIHDAVGARALRHEKDGRRLLFKAEWLDEYVQNGGWRAPNPRKRRAAR